jgi:hypothetical protein
LCGDVGADGAGVRGGGAKGERRKGKGERGFMDATTIFPEPLEIVNTLLFRSLFEIFLEYFSNRS